MQGSIERAARELLSAAGIGGNASFGRIQGGANNRAYLVEVEGEATAVLKAYFRHPDDPHDRLKTEYDFCRFVWQSGIRCIPEPIQCDATHGLALYAFIDGRRPGSDDIGSVALQQAIEFFRHINRRDIRWKARSLNPAAEACFTLRDHVATVHRRINQLESAQSGTSTTAIQASKFISGDLSRAAGRVFESVERQARALRLTWDRELTEDESCVSPSDFGFHNSLLRRDGSFVFLDFEYAGWDDPAKMICDFFCQPAIPLPVACQPDFVTGIASSVPKSGTLETRVEILLPLYRLKWCCILLNDFLPTGKLRRRFANPTARGNDQLLRQLELASRQLEAIR